MTYSEGFRYTAHHRVARQGTEPTLLLTACASDHETAVLPRLWEDTVKISNCADYLVVPYSGKKNCKTCSLPGNN